jgi:hypothetical protein
MVSFCAQLRLLGVGGWLTCWVRAKDSECQVVWFDNGDGYFTSVPRPSFLFGRYEVREVISFTPSQHVEHSAYHEAAHAVLFRAAGAAVKSISVGRGFDFADRHGETDVKYDCPLDQVLVALAVGERSADRWMRELGLWRPERAWCNELLSRDDRAVAAEHVLESFGTGMTYGVAPGSWSD